MHEVEVIRLLNHQDEEVWKMWDDFDAIHKFHPDLTSSPIVGKVKKGQGTQRVCHLKDGNKIKEEIYEYDVAKKQMKFTLEADFMPFKSAFAEVNVLKKSATTSEVTFKISFDPKFGPLGFILGKIAIRPKLKAVMESIVSGLDSHLTAIKGNTA
ncbi:hypothetical protein A9Q84_14320 [Halobacteriovorax marinus]|uniref:Polyketide cyclase n=1 Tax=Halobacteriovorax marinus TaxID=97084 RepID=A0A1Y5FA89_9BACT|nr:hypothetical protein A9Q84_14320 [Halobacteriovorax marinus]